MIVRFDSLDRFERPKFYLCNPGSRYDNGAIKGIFGELHGTSDEELVLNFNAISEFNFRIVRFQRVDAQEDTYLRNLYCAVQNRRMIFIDDIGFFVITSVKDGYENGVRYKDVHAESCEAEIRNKMIPFIEDGTYPFTELLETVVAALPMWAIGRIDQAVAEKYRSFEDISEDLNCHAFMMENMQDAYECIFVFDCVNRIIHVYDQNAYVVQTSIHLTKDDLIGSIEVSEESGDLYTAISVLGDEELNIAPVNPLGTNTIYNFDYYIPWMSAELRSRVQSWKSLLESSFPSYYSANLEYYEKLTERSNGQAQLAMLETQLTMYRRCRENIVAESSTDQVGSYNQVIIENGGAPIVVAEDIASTLSSIDNLIAIADSEYTAENAALTDIENRLSILQDIVADIHNAVDIRQYFIDTTTSSAVVDGETVSIEDIDTHLLDELTHYIYEGSYTDEYITVTDDMSYSEKFGQMKILYDRAASRLERISQPSQEFSIDVENFLFAKRFQAFSEQLETGCLINVELDNDDIAALFLSTLTINYDDRSMHLTFGNRFHKYDTRSLFENILGDVKKSSNTLSYIKEILYPIKSGEFNSMKEALENSRTLAKNAVLASANEEVVLDDTGYTGRKRMPDGSFDRHQVKITGTNIAFTDDSWDTCKVALGQLLLGDNMSAYGINAQAIIGDMIIGNNLQIVDKDGNNLFSILDNKIASSVSDISGEVTELTQKADSVELRVTGLEKTAGDPDHVTTRIFRYTFDDLGLSIHKADEEIENKIDNTGMYVNRGPDNVLTANNRGVETLNIKARQFLIVGEHTRFEPYKGANDENRTACFYLSGG